MHQRLLYVRMKISLLENAIEDCVISPSEFTANN